MVLSSVKWLLETSGDVLKKFPLLIVLGTFLSLATAATYGQESGAPPGAPASTKTSEDKEPTKSLAAIFAAGRETKGSIDQFQKRVQHRLEKLNELEASVDLKSLHGQRVAVADCIKICDELYDEAGEILELASGLGPDLAIYRDALLQAPKNYLELAKHYEGMAAKTKFPEVQAHYSDYSVVARKFAEQYARQAADVGIQQEEVERRIQYVKDTRELIGNVKQLLTTIPAQGGEATAALLARIEKYAEMYNNSVTAMRGVADKLSSPPSLLPAAERNAGSAAPRPAPANASSTLKEQNNALLGRLRALQK